MSESFERLRTALADRYLVERELGAGGMAHVYLARDRRHDRPVAIKVLRDDLTASLGKERFLREIAIAAGLTHPHILPLHDSGEAAGLLYYVMPFVDGRSLRERLLDAGELPVSDAVRILRDVADALAEAHRAGVVHRDLKPENIMLRGRHALVADFGVAKALSEATGRQSLTTIGVAIGTPTYMSPEQATADTHLDQRSDIYSFGIVAFELLTGRPPFVTTSPQEMLAAHLTRPCPAIQEIRPGLPPMLAGLVMRCLEKRPADRWQSADEIVQLLEGILTPSGGVTPLGTQPIQAATQPPPSWRRFVVPFVASIAAVAAAAYWWTRPAPLPVIERQAAITSGSEFEIEPAVSPDGRFVAYVVGPLDSARIYVRQVDGGQAVALTRGGEGAERQPQWTRDGSRVAFVREGSVMSAPALGGDAMPLLLRGGGPAIAEFALAHDGERIAFTRQSRVVVRRIDGAGDSLVMEAGVAFSPVWAVGDERLAFVSGNSQYVRGTRTFGNLGPSSVWVADLAKGRWWPVTDSSATNASPAWAPDGKRLLFVSNRGGRRDIYITRVGAPGSLGSEPERLTTGALPHTIALTDDGKHLVYSAYDPTSTVYRLPFNRAGLRRFEDAERLTWETALTESMHPSADETWLYYDAAREGRSDLYRVRIGERESSRLSDHPADDFMPHPAPDGRRLVFQSFRNGTRDVFIQDVAGGAATVIAGTSAQENYPRWSPSGTRIAFTSVGIQVTEFDAGRWSPPRQISPVGVYPSWIADERGLLAQTGGQAIRVDFATGRVDTLVARSAFPDGVLLRVEPTRDGQRMILKTYHREVTRFWSMPITGGPRTLVAELSADHPSYRHDFSVGREHIYFAVDRRESDLWRLEVRWP